MNPLEGFYKLYKKYGPQNWWPAETPYEVMVGAILTQNTNWRNVEKAISNLKEAGLLHPEAILKAGRKELEEAIRPAGFYRQKAQRLKEATKKWIEIMEGGEERLEKLREEWLKVKGVGKETADSILLYALNKPIFVIDAYTKRFVFMEFNKVFKDYEEYRLFFEKGLPKDVELFKEYHALIVAWGKEHRKEWLKVKNNV